MKIYLLQWVDFLIHIWIITCLISTCSFLNVFIYNFLNQSCLMRISTGGLGIFLKAVISISEPFANSLLIFYLTYFFIYNKVLNTSILYILHNLSTYCKSYTTAIFAFPYKDSMFSYYISFYGCGPHCLT